MLIYIFFVVSGFILALPFAKQYLLNEKKVDLPTSSSLQQLGIRSSVVKVLHVEDTGKEEDVFDVHEPETLTWITNGYVSLDCGEEGLPAWGVCNLSSINLAALVNEKGEMDYKLLAKIAKIGKPVFLSRGNSGPVKAEQFSSHSAQQLNS